MQRNWGRTGTAGQRNSESFANAAEAQRAYQCEVWRRKARGYAEVHDEDKPRRSSTEQQTQALTAAEPLSESRRYMFVHNRHQRFVWLEQQGPQLRSANGSLSQLANCVVQTTSHVSQQDAQRDLHAQMREVLATGYTLNAFDAIRKAPVKKRSAKKAIKSAGATQVGTMGILW
jgi:predicted DNA-binding WGR domain protein